MKRGLIAAFILPFMILAARADYVIKDGNGMQQTVRSFDCSSGICPQMTPADQTGSAFGIKTNPFFSIGNVGRQTKTVCVAPTVTNATYGSGVVVGGLLTFPALFTASGSGVVKSVALTFTTLQNASFFLYPFFGSPTNATTWTDHSAAAMSAASDIFLAAAPIKLAIPDNTLGTITIYSANLDMGYWTGSTNGYFVLTPTITTASLGGTSNVVQICVTVQQDY